MTDRATARWIGAVVVAGTACAAGSAPAPVANTLAEASASAEVPAAADARAADDMHTSESTEPTPPRAPGDSEGPSDTSESAAAIAGSLDDDASADGTVLNTRRYQYASYFNRVRKALQDAWHPPDVARAAESRAVLAITIDSDGNLVRVTLERSSGSEADDQAAIDAVRDGAPFPGAPPGLLDPSTNTFEVRMTFIVAAAGKRVLRGA